MKTPSAREQMGDFSDDDYAEFQSVTFEIPKNLSFPRKPRTPIQKTGRQLVRNNNFLSNYLGA